MRFALLITLAAMAFGVVTALYEKPSDNETRCAQPLETIRTSPAKWRRCDAASKLGEIRTATGYESDQVVDGLASMLKNDQDPDARCFAAMALGRFKNNLKAVRALVYALEDNEDIVRNTIPSCLRSALKE